LAYTNVHLKNRRGKTIPGITGSSSNKIVGEVVDHFQIKACFLKDMSEKAMIERWEELPDIEG